MNPLKQKKLDRLLSFLVNEKEYVFLDSARVNEENRHSFLFLNPSSRLDFFPGDDPVVFFECLENVLAQGNYLAGWISYEFGYLLEQELVHLLPELPVTTPLLSFGVFCKPFICDHKTGDDSFSLLSSAGFPAFTLENIRPTQEKKSYLEAVRRIKKYIIAGDTYQVNYTLKLLFDFYGSVESFYSVLRANQSVSYGALLRLGDEHILSISPELFFRVDFDQVLVRPMKGTMKRGRDFQEDNELCEKLSKDPKNRSENVMIVDLLRNDLGRLTHQCSDDKVVTKSLFDVERFESVLQMTSTVFTKTTTNVFAQVSFLEFMKALFPCGSVTGAPKIRTMEIIRELEALPRGVYTGAIGYFAPDGRAVFNVPIRTIRLQDGKGEMGIGSGIVHDSVPEQEWEECMLKAHFLTRPVSRFVLIETLLLEPDGNYWLFEYHLQRMRQSAEYFSCHFDEKYFMTALGDLQRNCAGQVRRVRITLAKDGTLTIESAPCELPKKRILPVFPKIQKDLPSVALAGKCVDSSSPFFFHKTSNRDIFRQEFQRALEEGLFDILFLNERGELTEGCITNVIVYVDGEYRTPPTSSGLLAGTMRRKLLSDRNIPVLEKCISKEDLQRAVAIFCCNSVRGIVQVQL